MRSSFRQKSFFIITFFLCSLIHAGKLHEAINNLEIEKAIEIIRTTPDPTKLSARCRGFAPIHLAAQKGCLEIIKELLVHKADIARLNEHGYNAAQIALINGHDEIVDFLLDNGAVLESDLLFDELVKSNPSPRYDDPARIVENKEVRNILLELSCAEVFMYAYPLLINRKKVFHLINELLQADKKFIDEIKQEQLLEQINNKVFIQKIHSQRFHSLNDFIEQKDKKEGDKNSSRETITKDNLLESPLPKDDIRGSRQASNDSISKDGERNKINSNTNSREEFIPKKGSKPCLSDESVNSEVIHGFEEEAIISIDEFLSSTNAISLHDIQALKERFNVHRPLSNDLVHDMLYSFAAEGFPAGGYGIAELKRLANFLTETNASSLLHRKIWSSLWAKKKQIELINQKNKDLQLSLPPKKKTYKKFALTELKLLWNSYSAKELAQIFTKRDAQLFQKISLENLYSHITGKIPVAIKNCINHNNARVNFFSFLVVSENNKTERLKIVRKLLQLMSHFARINNFFGLQQIGLSLSHSDVYRLITWNDDSNLYKKYIKFQNLITPIGNFNNLRAALKAIPENTPCVPGMAIFFRDFMTGMEMKIYSLNGFAHLGLTLKNFIRFTKLSSLYTFGEPMIDTFDKIPLIPEDVITEFSLAQKSDNKIRFMPNTRLIEWTCSELASCIYEGNNKKTMLKILRNYIWSGKDIIKILSTCRTAKAKFALLDTYGIDNVTKCLLVNEANINNKHVIRRTTDNGGGTQRIPKNKNNTP